MNSAKNTKFFQFFIRNWSILKEQLSVNLDFAVFFRYFYNAKIQVYLVNSHCRKYCLCTFLFFSMTYIAFAQSNTVTIIGDPASEAPSNSSGGGNPYIQSTMPQKDQQLATPQNIEPTFENGFHIRYDVNEPEKVDERPGSTGYEYASIAAGSGGGSGMKVKRKHNASFTERTFHFKKKVKTWIPKRKKKYRPNVCGRF